MQNPALLIIDMVNDSFSPENQWLRNKLTGPINELLKSFHQKNLPVLWIKQEFEPDLSDAFVEMRKKKIQKYIKGTKGAEIIPELNLSPSDQVLVKKRYSPFYGTKLDSLLAEIKPDVLILAGVNTHACIRTCAIDAYQRDWNVVLAQECVGSFDREHHEISIKYMVGKICDAFSNKEIIEQLK